MKLLAVAAIGVIACLGTPDVGFAKSSFGLKCSEVREQAHHAYTQVDMLLTLNLDLLKKSLAYSEANKADSPDLQRRLNNQTETRKELLADAAHYAQIYSAFCK